MGTRLWTVGIVAALGALATSNLAAQDSADRVTVPFRDASKPRTLAVSTMNGSITIRGYNGNDAIVESAAIAREARHREEYKGMHQISGGGGIDVTEENNVVTVHTGMNSSNVVIQVPTQTTIRAKTMNGGKLVVENISGEVNAENMNGSITITSVSGSVLAHSSNGKVTVTLDKVTAGKDMSFTSMNGTVDVTLPADVKANVKMRTDNGEIWSDFDVKLGTSGTAPKVEDDRKNGGRYRVRVDKSVVGTINGGGPEITFVTYNGNIVIRKKQ
jgi:hypothetical protein